MSQLQNSSIYCAGAAAWQLSPGCSWRSLSSVAAQPSVGKCHRGQQNIARLPVCEDVNLFPMCTVPELNFSIVITWTKVSLFLFCTEVRTLYLYTSHDPFPHQMK